MPTYLIGDNQGCDKAFSSLLEKINFSASRDTLFLLGDLVNRGPQSAEVIRRCIRLGDAVKPLLGNHDLHCLASAYGVRKQGRRDTLQSILEAPDRQALLDWITCQPLVRTWQDNQGQRLLMVHAGVLPQWSFEKTIELANEVHQIIRSSALPDFLMHMYGNLPDRWNPSLVGMDKWRLIVNALTRIRFCTVDGAMDFESTESAYTAPSGLIPWFECPDRKTLHETIALGHWSTLGLINQPHLMALDTGCIWGGCLTAIEIGNSLQERTIHQVSCDQAQKPS